MAVTVKIPTQLRPATGGEAEAAVEGGTVAEVLDALYERHTGLRERIAGEDGGLRRFVNVYLGGEDVRFLDGLDTEGQDGAEVTILPAGAGGEWPRAARAPATASAGTSGCGSAGPGEGGPRAGDGVVEYFGLRFVGPGEVRLTVRPDLLNSGGLLSGVATYALVDYGMGSTLWPQTADDEGIATLNIAVNYLQTAREGEVVCRTVLDRRHRH